MLSPRLASRYAKSLLDISIEKGEQEKVYEDMLWLQQAIRGNRDLLNLLRSPIIKADKKEKVLSAVVGGRLSEILSKFMSLLIRKGRESFLPEIINSYITQYKVNKNIHTLKLTTAVPVSDEIKNQIVSKVVSESGFQNIELEEKVDPEILGGFILQMGDKLIDASIAYDLKEVERQFENNDFIYRVR